MRKSLPVRALFVLSTAFRSTINDEFHYFISPQLRETPRNHSIRSTTINSRLVSTAALVPPPEWIEPFTDISDVASCSKQLQPSIWVPRILQIIDNSPNMETKLTAYCGKFLIKLTPNFVAFVLGCPQLKSQPEAALRFFYWAGTQEKYKHKLECYISLIDVLSASNDVDTIRGVFNKFKEMGFLMTVYAANSLIRSFGNLGMVEELLWVWRRMKENGIEPTLYSFNFLLNGLVNSMFIESAERVFEVMENGKTRPDVVSYNTMIKGFCKAGKIVKAMQKFKEMEVGNVEPDKITYMTLMQACYAEGDFDTCLSLYHEMEEKGLEIPSHAYSLVIGGLCKYGKHAEGYAIFEDLICRGCKANVAIYTSLIDSNVKGGNVDEAMILLRRMKSEGFTPDEVTYGAIVNGLSKCGRLDEAMDYFKFCRDSGVRVNAMFYSSLIDGLGKVGRVDEAEILFEEMAKKGCTRDSYCYNALIDGLTKCGKIDEALTLFKQMDEEGCDQTVYSYTILMDGLFKQHRNEEALKLWNSMIDKGITPTAASFRVLSFGLCLSGKVTRACKILDDLAPMGVIPENAFEDMINVLCKAGRIEQACKLADGIVARGREIPGRVRTVLINALRKAGNSDMAIKLMHSKIGIGYDRMGSIKRLPWKSVHLVTKPVWPATRPSSVQCRAINLDTGQPVHRIALRSSHVSLLIMARFKASRVLEEGTGSGFAVGGEPSAPSAKASRELGVVGVVSVPKVGGEIRPICESAQVREEVLNVEVVLTEERVPNLSTKLALVPEEPLVCPANIGKDAEVTGIVEVSRLGTPASNLVASSFHPSLRGNRSEQESTPTLIPMASSSHQICNKAARCTTGFSKLKDDDDSANARAESTAIQCCSLALFLFRWLIFINSTAL
ncbi:hypothetical protein Nepgr_012894 [Nepenthes gracilis]|uniref:Pentatricopeptide repeat-containing protein n=1 Tax=Nepenthes gracilis TaxID=150966 RepID=A0AAD3XNH8_NEPGR|nr:hypothetical protein Nepgr_012894 [Nepenthes gracilis]